MNETLWLWGVRAAGAFHFVTLILACYTPIPPDWEKNLAALPDVHRRFAVAQNAFIGAVIAFCGLVSLVFAPELIAGTTAGRVLCAGIALWWGGRLLVLPWLGAHRHLQTPLLRIGFMLLLVECTVFAVGYGWLVVRGC